MIILSGNIASFSYSSKYFSDILIHQSLVKHFCVSQFSQVIEASDAKKEESKVLLRKVLRFLLYKKIHCLLNTFIVLCYNYRKVDSFGVNLINDHTPKTDMQHLDHGDSFLKWDISISCKILKDIRNFEIKIVVK